jgi:protein TonB
VLVVACITLGGTALVLVGVALMNRSAAEREPVGRASVVSFTVAPVEPRQPEPRPDSTIEPPSPADANLAPPPDFGSRQSTVQIRMPEFTPRIGTEPASSLLGDLEHVELTEDTVDVKPVARSRPLNYPLLAKRRQIEGRVLVRVLIDREGRVQKVKILDSDPPGVFDDAVLEALPRWLFSPARYRGQAVAVWATVPLVFELL